MQIERSAASRSHQAWPASRAILMFGIVWLALAATMPASAQTLERIQEAGRIKLGYLVDSRPFAYRTEGGSAEGYAVTLCQQIVEQVKTQLKRPDLAVAWVPIRFDGMLREVQEGGIDLLCTPTSVTLTRRKAVAFSIPIFPAGNRAVVRADAPAALRQALAETRITRPVWRGSPAATLLENTSFAVVSGTTTQSWVARRRATFNIETTVVPVADYLKGLQQVLDRKVDVFFGDQALILGAMDAAARENLVILDRMFTREPFAFALARGDEDFRLLVDGTLSRFYASDAFPGLYRKWCGPFDESTRSFFEWNTLAP